MSHLQKTNGAGQKHDFMCKQFRTRRKGEKGVSGPVELGQVV